MDNGPLYGPEYLPRSCRTGRPVCYATAHEDWEDYHGAVGSHGLWDFEIDPGPPPEPREHDAIIAAALARFGREFSERERAIFEWYWTRRHSAEVIAVQLGYSISNVCYLITHVPRKARHLLSGNTPTRNLSPL